MSDTPTKDSPATQERFWRVECPDVTEDGRVLSGGMWPKQSEWWDLPNFIRMFIGGYGSGKTMTLCKRMIALALHNAPAPVAVVSPTYTMASETVITTIEELLEGKQSLLPGFKWDQLRKSPHTFRINYKGRKGRILVYSGEDPRKLKGPNLAAAGIDEPFMQHKDVFTQMIARCRHPKAKRIELNLTGTPEQLNWGYELAEGELGKGLDVGLVQSSTRDNLSLPSSYMQHLLGSLDEKTAAAFVDGQFVNLASGLVLYNFSRMEHVVDIPMPYEAELGVGMDFNVNPMAGVVFWLDRTKGHIHYFDELELPNSDTQDMCSELRTRYWDAGECDLYCERGEVYKTFAGLRDIYPDASGRNRATNAPAGMSDYRLITDAGFRINARPKNPGRRDRFNATNLRLRQLKITVSPRCSNIIRFFEQYSYEYMTKQEDMSHLFDAATYPVAHLFPMDRTLLNTTRLRGL
jgi:phage terminase large subunit